jgi:hypothetical protein
MGLSTFPAVKPPTLRAAQMQAIAKPKFDYSGREFWPGGFWPEENLFGCKRYPLRVRTLYLALSPTNFTVIARQPELGFGFG